MKSLAKLIWPSFDKVNFEHAKVQQSVKENVKEFKPEKDIFIVFVASSADFLATQFQLICTFKLNFQWNSLFLFPHSSSITHTLRWTDLISF